MKQVLKVSPEELVSAYSMMCSGSIHVGTVGFNINIANVFMCCLLRRRAAQSTLHPNIGPLALVQAAEMMGHCCKSKALSTYT